MGAGQDTLDLIGDLDTPASPTKTFPIGHYTTKGTLELIENTPAAKPTAEPMSQTAAALKGFQTGASSNWYPEFKGVSEASGLPDWLGGYRMPVGAVKVLGEQPEFGGKPGEATEAYIKAREEARAKVKAAYEQYPMTATGTDLLGGFMQPTSKMRPAAIGERILQNAATQGTMGAIRGASDGGGVEGAIQGAIPGAVLGAGIGAMGVKPRAPIVPNPAVEANERLGAGAPVGLLTDNPALNRIYQAGREIPFLNNLPIIGAERPVRKALTTMESVADDLSTKLGPAINPADKGTVGYGLKSGMADTMQFNTDKANAEFDNARRLFDPKREVPTPKFVTDQLDQVIEERKARGASEVLTGSLGEINNLLRRPQGATWNGLKDARSAIGKAITWDSINNGGQEEKGLRAAQRALTDAMENNVRSTAKGNPDKAMQAWKDANFAHQQKMDENQELDKLVRTGSAEALTDKALKWASIKGGDYDSLRKLHSAVSDQDWNNLAAHSINNMGKNNKGDWSPSFFVTRYNSMSPAAKNEMFGTGGTNTRQALDDIATLAAKFDKVGQFENKSHTGGAIMTGGLVGSALEGHNPVSIALSHWDKVLGVGAAAYLLTRPATAQTMARATKLYANITESPRVIGGRAMNAVAQDLSAKIGKTLGINVPASSLIPPNQPQQ